MRGVSERGVYVGYLAVLGDYPVRGFNLYTVGDYDGIGKEG